MAIQLEDLRNLSPTLPNQSFSSSHVATGIPIPKQVRVENFSPDEWEQFIEEWATSLSRRYGRVARFAGAGDMGMDVVGFTGGTFAEGWDNYQCKHYGHRLTPSDIWVEIGKVIYYSFTNEYPAPTKYFFVAPLNLGIKLQQLIATPIELKRQAADNWDRYCKNDISSTNSIELTGALKDHFDAFDFSIFSTMSVTELIRGHATTTFHAVRFGGGLNARPNPEPAPELIAVSENQYVRHLLDAYGDSMAERPESVAWLEGQPHLKTDFLRQRERFYHAESLRNFSRDTVPEGTFEELQEEVFQGVVDICESGHANGLECMRATLSQSAQLSISSNPLASAVKVQDKQGICHQLANDDRLLWVKKK